MAPEIYPLYGWEIDRKTLQPIGEHEELIKLHDDLHGWERFGEYNDNNFLDPFIEGAWMNKHNGKYYLQYGRPAQRSAVMAMGYMSAIIRWVHLPTRRTIPFPISPAVCTGSRHGALFRIAFGNWWHVSTMVVNVKNNFERRIGIWPAGFDKDGILYSNTAFGDYPQLPARKQKDHLSGNFTGWMLLNYNKPVQVSSTLGGYAANNAVDENIRTYWSAATGNPHEWIQTDLGQ